MGNRHIWGVEKDRERNKSRIQKRIDNKYNNRSTMDSEETCEKDEALKKWEEMREGHWRE